MLSTNNSSSSEAPNTAKCAIAEPLEQRRIGNKVKINHWQYKYILIKMVQKGIKLLEQH